MTVQIVAPKAVVLLGRVAQRALDGQEWLKAYRVFHLEHPAFILRTGGVDSRHYKNYVKKLKEVFKIV